MNKRQRKKRDKRADENFDTDGAIWRVTFRLTPPPTVLDRGFGRLFEGDTSRRDAFPQPYLSDGKENPAYARMVVPGGNFYGTRLEELLSET